VIAAGRFNAAGGTTTSFGGLTVTDEGNAVFRLGVRAPQAGHFFVVTGIPLAKVADQVHVLEQVEVDPVRVRLRTSDGTPAAVGFSVQVAEFKAD
jgi:hypothetical protein